MRVRVPSGAPLFVRLAKEGGDEAMDELSVEKLSEVQASLAPVVERLGEASVVLASRAVPLLGIPPATAPPAAVPLAKQLSAHAAPVALSAPLVSQSIPTLAQPI
uniref:Uncharacterized protein n=1 Tax=Ralstonia syzygii R24 TaxID=907261 RepID=G3A9R7_9RALS|nr:conserved hypothetical protein [Ralstonia syzygii R24]